MSGRGWRRPAATDRSLLDLWQPGSPLRRWLRTGADALFDVVDVGLLVVGSGLVGTGIALGLHGFGLVSLDLDQDLGQALAVALVTAMFGGFSLGLAVEGPIGHRRHTSAGEPWALAVASVPAVLVFVWVLGGLERLADRALTDFSAMFELVPSVLNAVQQSGVTVALFVGIPAVWAGRELAAHRFPSLRGMVLALLYLGWMLGTVFAYTAP